MCTLTTYMVLSIEQVSLSARDSFFICFLFELVIALPSSYSPGHNTHSMTIESGFDRKPITLTNTRHIIVEYKSFYIFGRCVE